MKIVYLDLDDIKNPLLNAGQARATYEVAKKMVEDGHEVTVLSSKYPGGHERNEDGINYRQIGVPTNNIKLNNIFYILSLPFHLRKIEADVVIECFAPPFSVLFSPLWTKIPVVILPSMFNAVEFSNKYKLPFHWVEQKGLGLYKYMMPYSNVDSAKALQMNPDLKIRIISQGVSEDYFKIQRQTPKHILYLGRYDIAQKGIDLLIESYALVKDQIPYPLVIAGHGADEVKIRELIKKHGLGKKVKMVGPAYGAKKFKLMSEALFVAFPSRHDEICLWTLEALAAGLPIVCFDLPESAWMKKSVALKARIFDIKDYSQLLLKACDKNVVKAMSISSKRMAKSFTWDKVASNFVGFFADIIKNERKMAIS